MHSPPNQWPPKANSALSSVQRAVGMFFVQTYSMVGLVSAAIRLSKRWDQVF
jgi:hypothetical protein